MGSRLSMRLRPLQAVLLALPLLALGCQNGGHSSPTEPVNSLAADAHGTGNGNGNGNGHGGNGGTGGNGGQGGNGHAGDLRLDVQPEVWNTNWAHASGLVQAFVRGGDAGRIDTATVELSADGGDSITPRSVRIAGGQLVASFSKSEAIGLFPDAHAGDTETLTLHFKVGTETKELTDAVRIVGPDGGTGGPGSSELRLDIQPDDWNVNWAHASGNLHAFLRGPGLADVDLDSIRLVGDKAGAEPLAPRDVRRVGNQIAARFSQSGAFATLDDPQAGERHEMTIRFSQAGADKELTETVHVVGRR